MIQPRTYSVLLVPIVSKSSFLLLSSLAFLAAASLQSGGARSGDVGNDFRYEAGADIASLKDDMREIRAQAETAPCDFRALWNDAVRDFRILKADVAIDARLAARRIATLIKTT
jgi:hypothetical protein